MICVIQVQGERHFIWPIFYVVLFYYSVDLSLRIQRSSYNTENAHGYEPNVTRTIVEHAKDKKQQEGVDLSLRVYECKSNVVDLPCYSYNSMLPCVKLFVTLTSHSRRS